MSPPPNPVILAFTGASGAPYGVRLLDVLARHQIATELIISSHGWRLLETESGITSDAELRGPHRRRLVVDHHLSG